MSVTKPRTISTTVLVDEYVDVEVEIEEDELRDLCEGLDDSGPRTISTTVHIDEYVDAEVEIGEDELRDLGAGLDDAERFRRVARLFAQRFENAPGVVSLDRGRLRSMLVDVVDEAEALDVMESILDRWQP